LLAAAVYVLPVSGCVTLEYTKYTGSYAVDNTYQLNAPGAPLAALSATAPKLSNVVSTSTPAQPAPAAAGSGDYEAEWGVGVHAAPVIATLSPGVTVHPMVSYTYFNFDGGHDDRFELGGQVRKSFSGMGPRGLWVGGEAAYALFRTHIDNVDDTDNTNGWSAAALLGIPVGDAVRNASVFGALGLADYGGSSFIFRLGFDWQPSFMKR
jgi:hypothetical protein